MILFKIAKKEKRQVPYNTIADDDLIGVPSLGIRLETNWKEFQFFRFTGEWKKNNQWLCKELNRYMKFQTTCASKFYLENNYRANKSKMSSRLPSLWYGTTNENNEETSTPA